MYEINPRNKDSEAMAKSFNENDAAQRHLNGISLYIAVTDLLNVLMLRTQEMSVGCPAEWGTCAGIPGMVLRQSCQVLLASKRGFQHGIGAETKNERAGGRHRAQSSKQPELAVIQSPVMVPEKASNESRSSIDSESRVCNFCAPGLERRQPDPNRLQAPLGQSLQ